tara:strand:- start:59 stop:475 length:417 start_codon:yes stop_codon:yes gene_type:complete
MRKIAQDAARAFCSNRKFSRNNTQVRTSTTIGDKPMTELILHGHIIARQHNSQLFITLAGWPTTTTKSRLNALMAECHQSPRIIRFFQQDDEQYLGNVIGDRWTKQIDSRSWYKVHDLHPNTMRDELGIEKANHHANI